MASTAVSGRSHSDSLIAEAGSEQAGSPWRWWHFAGAAVAAVAAVFATGDAWGEIWHAATTEDESSHILLVGIAAPWIAWARRGRFRASRPVGMWVGPTIAILGCAAYLYGFYLRDNEFWFLGAILVLVGSVLSFFGIQVLIRLWPAFAVLAFLIPVPSAVRVRIGLPLQNFMAFMTQHLAEVLGFAIQRMDNLLVVNGQQIEVAEACNGMRMVFGLCLVAFTFAFVVPLRWPVRIAVLLGAPVLALLCNVLRMVPTVVLYGHAPRELAEQFHDASGWLMVPLAFLILLGSVQLLEWAELPVFSKRGSSTPKKPLGRPGPRRWAVVAPVVVTTVLLVGLPMAHGAFEVPPEIEAYHDRVKREGERVPKVIGEWYGKPVSVPAAALDLLDPNVLVSRRYTSLETERSVSLYLVQTRDARRMAFHYPPICYEHSGWDQAESVRREWLIRGLTIPVKVYTFEQQTVTGSRRINVVNVLILRDRMTVSMDPVFAMANDPERRHHGAAQIQLVFDGGMTPEECRKISRRLLRGCLPFIREVMEVSP